MKFNLLLMLQDKKIGIIWLFSVLLSILLTEAIVAVMGLLLKGEVSPDYLLTGLVASVFVASLIVAMLCYFLKLLGDNQLKLQTIIELEPECVKLLAADGTVLQMNKAGLQMMEAGSLRELVGHQAQQLVLPEYQADFIALIKSVFEGESSNLQFEMQGLKGTHRWLDTHAVPLRDTAGHITALLAVTRDITRQKHAEAELRASEKKFRLLIEQLPLALGLASNTGELLFINNRFKQIFGYTLDQIPTIEHWYKLAYPDEKYRRQVITRWNSAIEKAVTQETDIEPVEYHITCNNGEIRVMEIAGILFENSLLATFIDMTERKQAEELLQEKTIALLQSNADLEQFAYSVSHDMRQPLRSISGHLQLLVRSLHDKMDEDERINLNFALDGAKRMDAMILSLLDYSRIGRKTETKAWQNSRIALTEALDFLSPAIREAKVEVKITGEWGEIFASHDEITRLLMNLIGNAVKYREQHQPVCVEINSVMTADTWRVRVRDYGIGINPQQADRLFKFFSRLQSRSRFEGTGMGLALCRRIVEHHGGKIWLESAGEGQGSCFMFELPLNQQDEQQEYKHDSIE